MDYLAVWQDFSIKDLDKLYHFLGMHVQSYSDDLHVSLKQYMMEILDRMGMAKCKPYFTLVDTNPKVVAVDGPPMADASDFCSLAETLQ